MSRWSYQRELFGGLYTYHHDTTFSHIIFGTHLCNGRSLCFINSCMFLCISLWFIRCGSIQLDLFSQLGCKFERQNLSSIKPWHIFELVSVENSWSQLDIEQNMWLRSIVSHPEIWWWNDHVDGKWIFIANSANTLCLIISPSTLLYSPAVKSGCSDSPAQWLPSASLGLMRTDLLRSE